MKLKGTMALAIVAALYVAAQILADVTSLRILMIAGFSIDGGTLIYPFTFTLRDLVHKVAGIAVARALIVTAAIVNLIMAGLFHIVSIMPADMAVGPQVEFGTVLAPVWRIVIASILAEVVAEFIDGEVYQAWMERVGEKWQWMRVLLSNSVSVPLDSALFVVVAFGGVLPVAVTMSIFAANVIVKGAVTLVSMPWIYVVKDTSIQDYTR